MSANSGIGVSEELLKHFSEINLNANERMIKIQIVNEEMKETGKSGAGSNNWEKDFDLVKSLLDEKDASYILFRTDQKNESAKYLWYMLCYVPDTAPVRQKMMYASSRSNLKQSLGANNFIDEIFGTAFADFNNSGFQAYLKHKEAQVPLTATEEQAMEELEQGLFIGGAGTSTAYVHGVAFPVDDKVYAALDSLKSGSINYVQLGIDTEKERVTLEGSGNYSLNEIPDQVPKADARFHLWFWDHLYEDEEFHSLVFCYSCPTGDSGTKSAPVKQRMLYSSSKANVASIVEKAGLTIDAKLEINVGIEWNENELNHLIHPPKKEEKKTFAKPKPKGNRRLIKS